MQYKGLMPIEPGCLALVIDQEDSYNNGKSVTVGDFLGEYPEGGRLWQVDTELRFTPRGMSTEEAEQQGLAIFIPYAWERHLMRIDGLSEEEQNEEEEDLPILEEISV